MPGARSRHAPLRPDLFEVLLALSQQDLHGYGIVKEVERATRGRIRLAPSPLYRRLRRLIRDGVVVEADERPAPDVDDERRRYHRLTETGRCLLADEARRLTELAADERVRRLAMEPGLDRA